MFEPVDLLLMDIQPSQKHILDLLETPDAILKYGEAALNNAVITTDGNLCAWTVTDDTGSKILGTGGIFNVTNTVGECWLLLSSEYHIVAKSATRYVKKQLNSVDKIRLQAFADILGSDREGCSIAPQGDAFPNNREAKYLELLGFTYETTLEKTGLTGCDQKLYKIIRREQQLENT